MSTAISNVQRPEALQVLLQASSLLLNAGSEQELLAQTLEMASTLLVADAYGVWRESGAGVWNLIAERGLSSRYPRTMHVEAGRIWRGVWAVEDIGSDPRAIFSREIYQAEGLRSALLVPWSLGPTVHVAIVYYWRRRREFCSDDVDYALALSNISSSALNRLELHEQNQREKQRLAFLAEASVMLGSSLEYGTTLQQVAQLAVQQMAEWCAVHVLEEGEPRQVAVAHADPSMATFVEEYERLYPMTIDPERGVGRVLRTAEPELVSPVTDAMVLAAAVDSDHLAMLRRLSLSASMVVPLISQGRVMGAIRLLGTHGRLFGPDDVQLALDLGRRAAVAIENAQLHRALLEQDAELRLSHAAARMGSWSWDLRQDKLFWSQEFKAVHGLPDSVEPTAELSYELVHPEDRERSRSEFWAALESDSRLLNSEHRALTPDGRVLWLQVRGRIRRDGDGKAIWIAGLIIDVTESRLAEQALRRTEKLAAAGRLAATVAHEVNNPLEALVNLIYLAQQVQGLPEAAAAHLRVADDELRRIAHIVRQTLGFYREPSFPRPTAVRALVGEVLDLYRTRGVTRGVALKQTGDGAEDVEAVVIAGEIKQVLANLMANAIDATPTGGEVVVHVHGVGDEWVEIAVSDTGAGISAANRRHLFEPFFTTKADVGTGLGLWVSKGIVDKHGGTISVDEPDEALGGEGRGATVRVRLPISARISESAPDAQGAVE